MLARLLRANLATLIFIATVLPTKGIPEDHFGEYLSLGVSKNREAHVDFNEIYARITYPADWYAAFSKGKLMGSLVITKPANDDKLAPVATFSINPVSNLMRMRFRLVSEQVEVFTRTLSDSSDIQLLENNPVQRGGYIGSDLLMRFETTEGLVRRERRLYLAHDARDWLIIVSFVADESNWERFAPARATMFGTLSLR